MPSRDDLGRRVARISRPIVIRDVLVTPDVVLERLDGKRPGKAVRSAPDGLHPERDHLREGIDVLVPGAVEVAFEEQVLVAQLLPLALVGEAVDDRPAGVVDERELFELLEGLLDVAAGPEDSPEHERALAPDRR